MKYFFLLISLVFSSLILVAQDPPVPTLEYVNVLPNNTTMLMLSQPSFLEIQNDFPGLVPIRYEIYGANAIDGTYDFLDFINYDNDPSEPPVFYIDVDANADILERYYYVEMNYFGFSGTVTSDTVAAIYLQMDGSPTATQSTVFLEWNIDHITEGPSIMLQENVDNAGWDIIYVGNNSFDNFNKAIDHCHSPNPNIPIAYRIAVVHGADSVFSNVVDGLFSDTTAPDDIEIETITVNDNNIVELCWKESPAIDIGGYRFFTDGNIPVLPTINDGTVTSRAFPAPLPGQDPREGSVGYFVVPFDNCIQPTTGEGNAGTYFVGITDFHETIFLQAFYDVCSQGIDLVWTPYDDWDNGVNKYVIEASINNGPVFELAQLDGNVTSFTVTDIVENEDYCIVVKAIPNDTQIKVSQSNTFCLFTKYPEVAEDFGIKNVTVVSDNETLITIGIDPIVQGGRYRLERLSAYDDSYEPIGTYSQNLASGGAFDIVDVNVKNDEKFYQYRVVAVDSCLNDGSVSAISRSIHLEVNVDEGTLFNVLSWNQYISWDLGVQEYQIYFSENGQMPLTPKYVVNPSSFFKADDINDFLHTQSEFCYRVDAVEFGTGIISQSNIKCVNQDALFYLPNAIVLNGQNPVFQPKGGFIEFQSYEMAIYNRWGVELFVTNDFFTGWDGTYKGEYVREGVYAYFIKYKEGNGIERFRSGTLTVLQAY